MDQTTAVLLIAHGSRQAEANQDLHALAGRLKQIGPYTIVEAAFLELAPPDILAGAGECIRQGATNVLMIPYFLSSGVHLQRDLTAARDELSCLNPGIAFRLASPLGPHPLLDQIVLERVGEIVEKSN